jgi:bla regulator protein BlaR1
MPALFIFLLKVNIALIVFCLGYYLGLRKLTFYTLNRIYLVMAITFSSVYPLIDLKDFMLRHQEIVAPVQQVAINWNAPQQLIEQPGYWQWATMVFWLGATVFAARLMVQFISLYKLYRNSSPAIIQEHEVRVTNTNISPFSFWQQIYINPDNLDAADLKSILQHEQVHVKEWHTLDILLTEISVIFYWFNPGVWLMKKAVSENIEFITDRKILQQGIDTKAYQYSLLNVSIAQTTSAGIANHFNFSTLKKRIVMMNAKRSSNLNLTRYALLVPMVTVLLLVFSFSKAELIKNNRNQLTHLITATVNEQFKSTPESTPKVKPLQKLKNAKTIAKDTVDYRKSDSALIGNFSPIDFAKKMGHPLAKQIVVNYDATDTTRAYTINGVKLTKDEFTTITSNDTNKAKTLSVKVKPIKVDGINVYVTKSPPKDTSVTFTKVTGKNFSFVAKPITSVVSYSYNVPDKGQTTTVADKLRIVDGKEATEKDLKKISAGDIEKITVKEGKEMTDKYGDKAKNGVIFITTKKSK